MIALDLFAGTGWGVACQRLGIEEHGVEIMPEARASREAAGMSTVYSDVWDGLSDSSIVPAHDLLIASPPCQTFSMAGSGSGRKALDEVLDLIAEGAWALPGDELRQIAKECDLDDRTALVLSPLAYINQHRPTFVALEQVPTVLPVWSAVAIALSGIGYSVAVGVLNAEQYGVPQTRKRAILVARSDGQQAKLPTPTHSRYYSRDPKRLDEGVLPWVSMAEALGWDKKGTLRGNQRPGGGVDYQQREVTHPAQSITSNASRYLRSNYGTGGDPAARGERGEDQPAATVTSKADRAQWVHERPSPTIVGTRRSEGGMLAGRQLADDSRRDVGGKPGGVGLQGGQLAAVRLTAGEAAVLQSYSAEFPFQGTKTKRFLQIGNAVPPLLAEAVLKAAIS